MLNNYSYISTIFPHRQHIGNGLVLLYKDKCVIISTIMNALSSANRVGATVGVTLALLGSSLVKPSDVETSGVLSADPAIGQIFEAPDCNKAPNFADVRYLSHTLVNISSERYFEDTPQIQPKNKYDKNCDSRGVKLTLDANKLKPLKSHVLQKVLSSIVKIEAVDKLGAYYGSGFLFKADGENSTRIITAGHMVEDKNGEVTSVRRNDGSNVRTESLTGYLYDEYDDIGVGRITKSEKALLSKSALKPRDRKANPLKFGEQVYLVNFQNGRPVGEPAIYSAVLGNDELGNTGYKEMELLANVDPTKKDDELKPGGSGGVVVDKNGHVVAVSIEATVDKSYYYGCKGKDRPAVPLTFIGDIAASYYLDVKASECDEGVQGDTVRIIDRDGDFTPSIKAHGLTMAAR